MDFLTVLRGVAEDLTTVRDKVEDSRIVVVVCVEDDDKRGITMRVVGHRYGDGRKPVVQ